MEETTNAVNATDRPGWQVGFRTSIITVFIAAALFVGLTLVGGNRSSGSRRALWRANIPQIAGSPAPEQSTHDAADEADGPAATAMVTMGTARVATTG